MLYQQNNETNTSQDDQKRNGNWVTAVRFNIITISCRINLCRIEPAKFLVQNELTSRFLSIRIPVIIIEHLVIPTDNIIRILINIIRIYWFVYFQAILSIRFYIFGYDLPVLPQCAARRIIAKNIKSYTEKDFWLKINNRFWLYQKNSVEVIRYSIIMTKILMCDYNLLINLFQIRNFPHCIFYFMLTK